VARSSAVGGANWLPAGKDVGDTATLLAAARGTRQDITIINNSAQVIYLGPTNAVTAAVDNALKLAVGASVVLSTRGAVYAIAAVAVTDNSVQVVEVYDG
jgi:hypothetical protein